jgi:hypothetical protein
LSGTRAERVDFFPFSSGSELPPRRPSAPSIPVGSVKEAEKLQTTGTSTAATSKNSPDHRKNPAVAKTLLARGFFPFLPRRMIIPTAHINDEMERRDASFSGAADIIEYYERVIKTWCGETGRIMGAS